MTAPAENQAVPAATPLTFTWAVPTARAAARSMTPADELRRLFTPLPEAHAHRAPFAGRACELRVTAGGRVLLRRQQSATSWTPTASRWAYRTGAIGAQTAEPAVYTASVVNNQITSGNGPCYPSAPWRFTLARRAVIARRGLDRRARRALVRAS